MSETRTKKVLVTGFGGFLDIKTNPSWEIARRLPSQLLGSDGSTIELIVPEHPIAVSYHDILATAPKLIEQYSPDIVVHIGLKKESGDFNVELSAPRYGYQDVPDEKRKVFTRLENRKRFGKAADSLASTLDLQSAVSSAASAAASRVRSSGSAQHGKRSAKGQASKAVQVLVSDDVGTYVCGFVYYISMLEMQKLKGRRDVVFLHVPQLEGNQEVVAGVRVVEELIKGLVDGHR
ncbi:peptidase C15, pyroglutamyl peptidase I-like protein [Polyplosphaeria fusca]|uniref:Peptidase C15, pyroglutamyl peptidase I-like protein n=1 Tax=Polyplosphaeria fusca TaxID=682080 RepID=A0A9P4V0P9_9PLEO|nr:peptidase C15, pyroglutamyl peptidase I-like protein [Polyplosphaeria fusca]